MFHFRLSFSAEILYQQTGRVPQTFLCLNLRKNLQKCKCTWLVLYQLVKYSETWELGTPKGLSETVLNSEVVLFLRSISM